MTTPVPPAATPPSTAPNLGVALTALALGGFAIGTTEFVSMGLIEKIADGVSVSIPTAGHFISAYALGVVVGAPLIAYFGAALDRRKLLIWLMVGFVAANIASAVSANYGQLMAARFLSGMPHGAYFGVASVVAASLVPVARQGRAVAMVMLGLSVANVIGVPAATWLGQNVGWRAAFWIVASFGAATIAAVSVVLGPQPANANANGRRELAALRNPHVVLMLLVGAIGFGGMFALYSYVAPTLTRVGGLSESAVPFFLFSFGVGMVIGTAVAGELADRSTWGSLFLGAAGMGVVLVVFALVVPYGWWAILVTPWVSVLSSVLVVNLQMRLMSIAADAPTLGAASNHAALNLANALGAWVGGLVISADMGYRAPALAGACLSAAGVVVLIVAYVVRERDVTDSSTMPSVTTPTNP